MARLPVAPTQTDVKLRGDYASAGPDFRVEQVYDRYTDEEQAIWRTLYDRQLGLMADHAAPEFLAGLRLLGGDARRIPVLSEASERLKRLTGFEVIAVPGLLPEADFFGHLAERLQQLELHGERRQIEERGVRREELARVRLKDDGAGAAALRRGDTLRLVEHCLVTAMDTVEIADGEDSALESRRRVPPGADNVHR